MNIFSKIFGLGEKVDYKQLMADGAIAIDVRTKDEFSMNHAPKTQNIPLDSIAGKAGKIKKMNKPVIVCCATGMRSAQAKTILRGNGVGEVHNARSWKKLL